MRVLVSVVERDVPALGGQHRCGPALLDPLAHALEAAGLRVAENCAARADDVAALSSSWAKRLGIPERRPAWTLTATKLPSVARTVN